MVWLILRNRNKSALVQCICTSAVVNYFLSGSTFISHNMSMRVAGEDLPVLSSCFVNMF